MREVESKYYVPRFIYAQDNYPPYCYGAAYMYSGHRVADLFLDAVPQTPFLRSENFRRLSEDTIFTGLLRTLVDVPLQNNIGFSVYQDVSTSCCLDILNKPCRTIRIGVLMARVQRRSSSTARRSRFPSGRK